MNPQKGQAILIPGFSRFLRVKINYFPFPVLVINIKYMAHIVSELHLYWTITFKELKGNLDC